MGVVINRSKNNNRAPVKSIKLNRSVITNKFEYSEESAKLLALSKVKVSNNFFMRDFLLTCRDSQLGITNLPDDEAFVINSAKALARRVLDPVIGEFGPITVTYGYINRAISDVVSPSKKGAKKSMPHNWDRGTFGNSIYARVDFIVNRFISFDTNASYDTKLKHVIGKWIMYNCNVDLLQMWRSSNVFCVSICDKPRRVWHEWVNSGDGDGGTNRIEWMGVDFWLNKFPLLKNHKKKRPRYFPSYTSGEMFWKEDNEPIVVTLIHGKKYWVDYGHRKAELLLKRKEPVVAMDSITGDLVTINDRRNLRIRDKSYV
jgi:hypothetical protein